MGMILVSLNKFLGYKSLDFWHAILVSFSPPDDSLALGS